MEHRPPQKSGTKITENDIHQGIEVENQEEKYLSHDELEEYQKVQEVLLKFSRTILDNKSDLRKFLLNIIMSSSRLLVLLEDTLNQETADTGAKNSKANQQHKSDESKKSSTEGEITPKKINGHLGQKKDEKYEQIPQVTIQRISCNNKPRDTLLHENDDCRMKDKTSNTKSSQCMQVLQENCTQTLVKKEVHDTQLNNKIEIEFECQNVKPNVISLVPEKSDISIDLQPKQENEKIPPLKSMHRNKNSKKLEACSKNFVRKSNLKIHKHAARDRITHSCDICGKKFMQKHKLKIHTEVHNRRKHHKCDEGVKMFKKKTTLDRHIETLHSGITHACDSCDKIFTRKDNLKTHVDSVHKGLTHPCDLCKKVFTQKSSLKEHKDSVHKGITHPCDLCDKVFTLKGSLKEHKDSVHKGITHPCDLCYKVFRQKSHLKVHKDSVHNGITHSCDQCEKSFAQKGNLKIHINEVHNGKK